MKKERTILTIDTTSSFQNITIWHDGRILSYINSFIKSSHTETLISNIEHLFKLTGLSLREINTIATVTGPGSFTGIRIGMSTTAGLSEGLKINPMGCNALLLTCMQPFLSEGYICPILDARRNSLYTTLFKKYHNKLEQVLPYREIHVEEMKQFTEDFDDVIMIGSGIRRILPLHEKIRNKKYTIVEHELFPLSSVLAYVIGAEIFKLPAGSLKFEPFYIRPPDAKLPNKKH